MSSIFGQISKFFAFVIIIVALIIIHFWYIILPIIGIMVGVYLYYKHQQIEQEKERIREEGIRERIMREIIIKEERIREEGIREKRIREEGIREKRIRDKKLEKERLEKERLEKERIQKEQEEKQIREEEEERKIKEKKLLVETRLEKFKISRKEANLIFGKTWEKRLEKHDGEFIKEIIRVGEKLGGSESYRIKISSIMEKALDLMDICMHDIVGKMNNWDDIDYENWEENWQDVRDTWKKEKHYYQNNEDDSSEENSKEENSSDYSKYYEILGLRMGATIMEIKMQYRTLIKKFHPDKNTSPDAEEKCKEIIDAYNKLTEMLAR